MTEKDGQILGYEDVEKYTFASYLGRAGWVLDKGDHISKADGRHLLVEFDGDEGQLDEIPIHENLVDKYLRQKNTLWIDFSKDFSGFNEEKE